MDETPNVIQLTEDEARTLTAARDVLDSVRERIDAALVAASSELFQGRYSSANIGRVQQAASAAEYSIFTFLNVAGTYGHDSVADTWVHGTPTEEVPA